MTFCSVVVACDDALLFCVRNQRGWPTGVDLAKQETEKGDQKRKELTHMLVNLKF